MRPHTLQLGHSTRAKLSHTTTHDATYLADTDTCEPTARLHVRQLLFRTSCGLSLCAQDVQGAAFVDRRERLDYVHGVIMASPAVPAEFGVLGSQVAFRTRACVREGVVGDDSCRGNQNRRKSRRSLEESAAHRGLA